MKTDDVVKFLAYSDFTGDELNRLRSALSRAITRRQTEAARKFRLGDKVKFAAKSGTEITGVIKKINTKTIIVQTALNGNWRVSPALLSNV